MKKILTHWSMAFITLAAITFLGLKEPQVKEILRLKAFDLLLQSETKQVSQDVGVITIDEKAIEKYGQWPWKRDILAEVISFISIAVAHVFRFFFLKHSINGFL